MAKKYGGARRKVYRLRRSEIARAERQATQRDMSLSALIYRTLTDYVAVGSRYEPDPMQPVQVIGEPEVFRAAEERAAREGVHVRDVLSFELSRLT